jgi:protein kinase A
MTTFALKIQCKKELIKHGQAAGVIREKNLMASIDHPFVIKLVNAFQDSHNLYMMMKLAQGGELFSIIHTESSDGVPEKAAKFYAANIYDGLMHMHSKNILFRDLKPENVLLDNDGYCILIDLGFAKVVTDKTYTLCGTPLYLAPEILLSRGYDNSVDNWSFGVLVYEMLLGYSPFYTHNIDQMELYKRIVKIRYNFPNWCESSSEAKDLVKKILILKPTERLGGLANGDADIRQHPWLASLTVEDMLAKKVVSPWKPKIKDPTDVSNFDNWDHLEDKGIARGPAPTKKEQDVFKDF